MISSPGWVCLAANTPGAMSTRTCIISRPGILRSCCCKSVRLTPDCCANAEPVKANTVNIRVAMLLVRIFLFIFLLFVKVQSACSYCQQLFGEVDEFVLGVGAF